MKPFHTNIVIQSINQRLCPLISNLMVSKIQVPQSLIVLERLRNSLSSSRSNIAASKIHYLHSLIVLQEIGNDFCSIVPNEAAPEVQLRQLALHQSCSLLLLPVHTQESSQRVLSWREEK